MNIIKYIFCGPKLRSKILRKIQDTETTIQEFNLQKESAIKDNLNATANSIFGQIRNQEIIITVLKDLLR